MFSYVHFLYSLSSEHGGHLLQYFVECRQPVEVNMLQFVSIFHKTQPVEAGDEIKNMRKLGELDSGHREEIPKPGRRGNLCNVRIIVMHGQF